jgi:flagellar biosynthetic protein FliR
VTIDVDPVLLTAFAIALVRASAWLFIAPPFNTRIVPIPVKAGVAAALALTAAPHIADPGLVGSTGEFVGMLVVQAFIGVAFGLLTLLLFSAAQAAGSLIDHFAGFTLASILDPFSDSGSSMFGRFYQLVAVTLLFATNGHLLLVRGFLHSFEAIPVSGSIANEFADLLTANLGHFFVAAIEIAGPVAACLFVAELTMGLLARAAPSLNVFALAFPLRVGVTLIVTAVALPLLAPAIVNLVHQAVGFGAS